MSTTANREQAAGPTHTPLNNQTSQAAHRQDASLRIPASAPQQQNGTQQQNAAPGGQAASRDGAAMDAGSQLIGEWRGIVMRQMQELKNDASLSHPVEQPRYHLLIDACSRRDVFYLLFHQVFCLWTLNKTEVYRMLAAESAVIDDAFTKLTTILKSTDIMALRHITWFTRFPPSCTDDRFPPAVFRHIVMQVAEFIRSFSTRWESLRVDVQRRNYPLMAWESAQVLQCHSITLSELLFTFLRRTLGCEDGLIATELSQYFAEDTQNEAMYGYMVAPTVDPAADRRRQEMSIRYSTLLSVGQRESAQRSTWETQIICSSAAISIRRKLTIDAGRSGNQSATPNTQPRSGSIPSQVQATSPQTQVSTSLPRSPSGSKPQASSRSSSVQQSTTAAAARSAMSHASGISPPPITAASPRKATTTANTTTSFPSTSVQPQQQSPAPAISQTSSPISQNAPPTNTSTSPPSTQTQPISGLPEYTPLYTFNSDGIKEKWIRQTLAQGAAKRIPVSYHGRGPYDWTSIRTSLHLVGSRSPRRVPAKPYQSRFYQSLSHFAIGPRETPAILGLKRLEFEMTETDMQLLPCLMPTHETITTPVVSYFEDCRRYRLRICKVGNTTNVITDAEWAVLPGYWPENIQVNFNNTPIQLQRRHQYHFDLPADLTSLVKQGTNTVKISLPGSKSNIIEGSTFFAAVEVVTTLSHEAVIDLVQRSPHCTLEQTRNEISKRPGLAGQGDDDIMITDDSLVVTVADPFTSFIFTIPVRGINCQHLECFDLDNWLQTRPSKTNLIAEDSRPEPSLADNWRCPFCGEDARPQSLRIDELFVGIRSILESEGKLDVKKIRISSNGSWTALEENPKASVDRQRPQSQGDMKGETRAIITSTTEVIELDDD